MKVTLKKEVINNLGLTGNEMYVLLAILNGVRTTDELAKALESLKEKGFVTERNGSYDYTNAAVELSTRFFLESDGYDYEKACETARTLNDMWPNGVKSRTGNNVVLWKEGTKTTLDNLCVLCSTLEYRLDFEEIIGAATRYLDLFDDDKELMETLNDFVVRQDGDKVESILLKMINERKASR